MTLQSAIQLYDGMSGPLKSMHSVMSTVISSFQSLQDTSSQAIDVDALSAAQMELANVGSAITVMEENLQRAQREQQQFNQDIRNGGVEADALGSKIKQFVSAYAGMAALRRGKSWIMESLELADTQMNVERQLKTVLNNMGAADDAFASIQRRASEIQSYTLYGDEAMIGGAAEMATYIKDADAIESMMGTLANYAAGMSGGGAVSTQQMVEYATQLGKALDGTYTGLRQRGFDLSDVQKEIIEYGTDIEKALVIEDVINQSWRDLAAQMANTPQGIIINMAKDFGDVREEVAGGLYPHIIRLFQAIRANMPTITTAMHSLGSAAGRVVVILSGLVGVAASVAATIGDNWSWLSPIIWGVVGAMAAYKTITLLSAAAQGISTLVQTAHAIAIAVKTGATIKDVAATNQMTVAQWALNSAMLASPITWVIIGLIVIIALVYAVVGVINKVTGASVSATGIICGAVAVAGAFIGNLFIGLLNGLIQLLWSLFVEPFLGIVEWVLNVANGGFDSFGGAVANLIGQIIGWFLSLGTVVTKIIDAIFGTDWTAGLNALKSDVTAWGANEQAITLDRNAPAIDHRFAYGDAWDAGYDFGEGIEDKLSSLFGSDPLPDDAFDDPLSGMEDYLEEIMGDTGAIRDSVELSTEDLKYLRDLAEQEVINRFTTAEINVDMVNHNTITKEADSDGVIGRLVDGVEEAMFVAAEGVH